MGPDEHEEFALVLEQFESGLGRKWAARVRNCNHPLFFPKKMCRWRACPSCSKRYQQQVRRKLIDAMIGMPNPQLYVAQVFTTCIGDQRELSEVIDLLLRSFRLLWNRKVLRHAERAVGFVEVALSDFGDEWNVHMHLVVEAPAASVSTDLVDRAWRRLTHPRRGKFITDGDARSPEAIATYITKATSYSPRTGRLPNVALETLLLALHGRRLPIIRRSRRARSEHGRTVDRNE